MVAGCDAMALRIRYKPLQLGFPFLLPSLSIPRTLASIWSRTCGSVMLTTRVRLLVLAWAAAGSGGVYQFRIWDAASMMGVGLLVVHDGVRGNRAVCGLSWSFSVHVARHVALGYLGQAGQGVG